MAYGKYWVECWPPLWGIHLYYTRIAPTLTQEKEKPTYFSGFSGRGDRVRTCFGTYFTNKNPLFSVLFGFVLISQIGNFCPNIAPKLTQRCPNIRTIKTPDIISLCQCHKIASKSPANRRQVKAVKTAQKKDPTSEEVGSVRRGGSGRGWPPELLI